MANPTTVIVWLNLMEEPYRSKAIANCTWPNRNVSSQSDALWVAFSWKDSPEKGDYWDKVHQQLKAKEEQAKQTETPYKVSELWEVAQNGQALIDVIELAELRRKASLYDKIESVVKGGGNG